MRPTLDGDTIASIDTTYSVLIDTTGGWSIRVEGDCTLHRGAEEIHAVDEQFSVLEPVLSSWVGEPIQGLEYGTTGGLVVHCRGDRLVIPPSADYEAWGLAGPRQEKVISLPGGDVTTWEGV